MHLFTFLCGTVVEPMKSAPPVISGLNGQRRSRGMMVVHITVHIRDLEGPKS
jgi:hypothetical protein